MFWEEAGLKTFLIVKTSALGDIVHAYPVVSYLKEKFPDCVIDWIVEKPFAELVSSHPQMRKAIHVQTKKWIKSPFSKETRQEFRAFKKQLDCYDLIIDLQGNMKSAFLGYCAKGKIRIGFGRKSVPEWPNLLFNNHRYDPPPEINIRHEYLSLVQQYFQDHQAYIPPAVPLNSDFDPTPYLSSTSRNLMVCAGANWENKRLSTETLLTYLHKQENTHILLTWGNEEEKEYAASLQKQLIDAIVIPKLPFPDLQKLMASVDFVFSVDSFPLHLAGTTATPTFSVFGPSLAEKYRPLGPQHRSIQGECPYGIQFKRRCPRLRTCETGACIKIGSENAGASATSFINRSS